MDKVKYLSSLWTDLLPNRSREAYTIDLKTPFCSIANNSPWPCHFYKYLRTQGMNVVEEVFTMNTTCVSSRFASRLFWFSFPYLSLWVS